MGVEHLEGWRRILEQHLARLGRDDLGVGDITMAGSEELQIEFIKGDLRRTATVALDDLRDPDRARAALNTALLRISKAIERQHIQAAHKAK